MSTSKDIIYVIIIILFLVFLYHYIINRKKYKIEKFQNYNNNCPNVLIEKDGKIFLLNTKKVQVPGVNPIVFENLEDYTEFLAWQRHAGIRCPVLYLQKTNNAQGVDEYKIRPNIYEKGGGLPSVINTNTLLYDATRNDPPYNQHNYPGYDPTSQYVGAKTPLDKMNANENKLLISPDPMNSNWGGAAFTQALIDKGYYKGNEVSLYVP